MNLKSLFAVLLTLVLLICTCILPTSAKETTENNTDVEIIINDAVSAETKTKIEKFFATGEPMIDTSVSTYGLTCTLLGHNTKISSVSTITHKVRATAPRCLERTYNYEECTRCDYNNATLIFSEYIVCCS